MLKFAIFSDYHYWKTHYPQDLSGLETIMKRAADEKVDFIIHCGDLCHDAPTSPEIREVYVNNRYGIPALGCLGNHEVEASDSLAEVIKAYDMPSNYYFRDLGGYRLIVLDTNYYLDGSELRHNPPHSHSRPMGDRLPPDELNWLADTLDSAAGSCIIFSHASLEEPCGCPQSEEVREILRSRPGKVLMCCNGHHHTNSLNVSEGILWFDVNATYNVLWAQMDNPLFPEDFKKSARMARNCCFTATPLSAIVTIDGDRITVEGARSEYLYGASPEKLGLDKPNRFGRHPSAEISGGVFRLGQ